MLSKATDNLTGVALIVIQVYIRVQDLINVVGRNMDVQVSLDFASAGIYAAQYAITNS